MEASAEVPGNADKSGQEGQNPIGEYVIERFRWWHIDEVLPIEEDLFGPEKWSPAMFWNELATGQFYLVALGGKSASGTGVGGTGVGGAGAAGAAGAGVGGAGVGGAGAGGTGAGGNDVGGTGAGGRVFGYAGLSVVDEHESWVQNIAVRRDAQRLGLGRRLLEALLAEAARRGSRKTLLEVAVDNAPAQKLYAMYGFEPVGIRRGYYQPSNTDALVMMRDA